MTQTPTTSTVLPIPTAVDAGRPRQRSIPPRETVEFASGKFGQRLRKGISRAARCSGGAILCARFETGERIELLTDIRDGCFVARGVIPGKGEIAGVWRNDEVARHNYLWVVSWDVGDTFVSQSYSSFDFKATEYGDEVTKGMAPWFIRMFL